MCPDIFMFYILCIEFQSHEKMLDIGDQDIETGDIYIVNKKAHFQMHSTLLVVKNEWFTCQSVYMCTFLPQ